jgi:rhodanese-related sulfurtransferase
MERTARLIPELNMNEITIAEFLELRAAGKPHQLIDLREAYEAERCGLGGQLIPMGEILDRREELRRDVPVIMHCKSGNRAGAVVQALTARYGFTNVVNLKGGVEAWKVEVDQNINCD